MKRVGRNTVVVITGASSGIGRATALRFAEAHASVVLGARREKLLDDVAEEVEERGGRALAVDTDVSDPESVQELREAAVKKFGHIDVWVNDAGVAVMGEFDRVPMEEHEKVIATNLMGTIYGSREALEEFKKRDRGVLVNVSSVLGKASHPYQSSYVASKHAITGLDMSLRQEMLLQDQKNIHVCTVFPESVDTPFFEHAANRVGRRVKPVPPVVTPEEVAEVIFDLASKPKDEVFVGAMGKVISGQMKVARALTERQMAWMTHNRQFEWDKESRETSGALFEPMKRGDGVRGGWKDEGGGFGHVLKTGVAIAAPVIAGLLLRRSRGGQRQERTAA